LGLMTDVPYWPAAPVGVAPPMKWKLFTRDDNVRPPIVGSAQHDSKDDALEAACDYGRQGHHIAVLYIEGPNGERIESKDIAAWCKLHSPS
jgi:hypothetical protein